ncbi:MAG: hypothetical protein V8T86_09715 [Victivallis sp.]
MERYIDKFMAAFEFEGLTFDDISLVTSTPTSCRTTRTSRAASRGTSS